MNTKLVTRGTARSAAVSALDVLRNVATSTNGGWAEEFPEPLPVQERVLWQGSPNWRALARSAFHVRGLGIYFGVILVVCAYSSLASGMPLGAAALSTLRLALYACIPLVLLCAYAWATSRATIYTITSRRVVIQMGLSVPMTLNIPLTKVHGASVKAHADGFGDIALQVDPQDRIGYFILWPHARPWRLSHAEPSLRGIADVAGAAKFLAKALAVSPGTTTAAPETPGRNIQAGLSGGKVSDIGGSALNPAAA